MNMYRIKFSYERILDDEVTELDEDLLGTSGIIDISSGAAEIATVVEGDTLASVFKNLGDSLAALNGVWEERLENSVETFIQERKSQGIEIRRINWVEEKK